jgi:hypothetical protein
MPANNSVKRAHAGHPRIQPAVRAAIVTTDQIAMEGAVRITYRRFRLLRASAIGLNNVGWAFAM